MLQCSLVFDLQPSSYATDRAKLAFVVNLLRGKAGEWANSLWEAQSPLLASFETFATEMKKVFDHPFRNLTSAHRLLSLHQGNQSVAEFSIEFRILAAESGWDDLALKSAFLKGLSEEVQDQLATRDEPDSLESLINLAIRIDNRLRERRRARRGLPSLHPRRPVNQPVPAPGTAVPDTVVPEAEEPMHLGRTCLTPEQRSQRIADGLCIYCGQPGHYISQCPLRPKSARPSPTPRIGVSDTRLFLTSQPHFCLPATISYQGRSVSVTVLVDSGADDNFVDREFIQSVKFPLSKIEIPRPVKAFDDTPLETVTHQTTSLALTLSGNHQERLTFLVVSSPSSPVVLGLPWLKAHNPHID